MFGNVLVTKEIKMKVETVEPKFNPISIVLETPEEVVKFYAILNSVKIINALEINKEAEKIRHSISKVIPNAYQLSMKWWNILDDRCF